MIQQVNSEGKQCEICATESFMGGFCTCTYEKHCWNWGSVLPLRNMFIHRVSQWLGVVEMTDLLTKAKTGAQKINPVFGFSCPLAEVLLC